MNSSMYEVPENNNSRQAGSKSDRHTTLISLFASPRRHLMQSVIMPRIRDMETVTTLCAIVAGTVGIVIVLNA
jgi:hypothetical protein